MEQPNTEPTIEQRLQKLESANRRQRLLIAILGVPIFLSLTLFSPWHWGLLQLPLQTGQLHVATHDGSANTTIDGTTGLQIRNVLLNQLVTLQADAAGTRLIFVQFGGKAGPQPNLQMGLDMHGEAYMSSDDGITRSFLIPQPKK